MGGRVHEIPGLARGSSALARGQLKEIRHICPSVSLSGWLCPAPSALNGIRRIVSGGSESLRRFPVKETEPAREETEQKLQQISCG
jgi:hypothetical protein